MVFPLTVSSPGQETQIHSTFCIPRASWIDFSEFISWCLGQEEGGFCPSPGSLLEARISPLPRCLGGLGKGTGDASPAPLFQWHQQPRASREISSQHLYL